MASASWLISYNNVYYQQHQLPFSNCFPSNFPSVFFFSQSLPLFFSSILAPVFLPPPFLLSLSCVSPSSFLSLSLSLFSSSLSHLFLLSFYQYRLLRNSLNTQLFVFLKGKQIAVEMLWHSNYTSQKTILVNSKAWEEIARLFFVFFTVCWAWFDCIVFSWKTII